MKNTTLFALALVLSLCNRALSQETFIKGYYDFSGFSIQQTYDAGFILTGTSGLGTSTDAYLMKTDSEGNVQWTKSYGGDSADYFDHVSQTSDSGYILTGRTKSFGEGMDDIYVVRTNSDGDTLWTRTYGGTNEDFGTYTQAAIDGGCFVFGSTLIANAYATRVLKINNNGDLLWSKLYGLYDLSRLLKSAQQTLDKGLIMVGQIWADGTGGSAYYALKTDSDGNIEWSKYYNSPNNGYPSVGQCVNQSSDGGYLIAGQKAVYNVYNGLFMFSIIKLNSSGNIMWKKEYGDTAAFPLDVAYSIEETLDGGIISAGITNCFNNLQMYLVKTDNHGNLLWSKTFGGSNSIGGSSAIEAKDSGFVFVGGIGFGVPFTIVKTDVNGNLDCLNNFDPPSHQYSFFLQTYDANDSILADSFVIGKPKTQVNTFTISDSSFCLATNIIEHPTESKVDIYPNPSSGLVTISSDDNLAGNTIEIYDAMGHKVYSKQIAGIEKTVSHSLPHGIYLIKVVGKNKITMNKLIVQ